MQSSFPDTCPQCSGSDLVAGARVPGEIPAAPSLVVGVARPDTSEALRAWFGHESLWNKWKKGAPCALFRALEILPRELWGGGVLCPAERTVMLGATSKRVRALLARLQWRVPAAVQVVSVGTWH